MHDFLFFPLCVIFSNITETPLLFPCTGLEHIHSSLLDCGTAYAMFMPQPAWCVSGHDILPRNTIELTGVIYDRYGRILVGVECKNVHVPRFGRLLKSPRQ